VRVGAATAAGRFYARQALGPLRRLHVGGDEARRLGSCPRCHAAVAGGAGAGGDGVAGLYGRHTGAVCAGLLERGLQPIVWSDMLEHHPAAERYLPPETAIMYWNYTPFRSSRPLAIDRFVASGRAVIGASGARFGRPNHTMFFFAEAMRGVAAVAHLCRTAGAAGAVVTDWTKSVPADLTLPCHVYGAARAWGEAGPQADFARRFARLHTGAEWDWAAVYAAFEAPVPYAEDAYQRVRDRLDRYDLSGLSFAERVVAHTGQDGRPEAVARLTAARASAASARRLLDDVPPGARDSLLWAHLDLAARTQAHVADLGLAIDAAVRLLKYPLPDDASERERVAGDLEALLRRGPALRRESTALLARTTWGRVAANVAAVRLDPDGERYAAALASDLRAGRRRWGVLVPGEDAPTAGAAGSGAPGA
jgi:hypothetical protein